MSEPARPIIAATAATLLHLMLLAWLLPGFDLWRASDGAAGRAVSVSGEAEFDLPFVPVTLPSGALELVWSLGSIQQAAPQPTPRFQRPRGMRPGHLALSQMGDAEAEAGQAAVRVAVADARDRLNALADAPAEFVGDIRLAGAQLKLAPLAGALALREAEALSHQTRGRDAQLASAPQRPNAAPAAPASTSTGTPTPPRAAAAKIAPSATSTPDVAPSARLQPRPTAAAPASSRPPVAPSPTAPRPTTTPAPAEPSAPPAATTTPPPSTSPSPSLRPTARATPPPTALPTVPPTPVTSDLALPDPTWLIGEVDTPLPITPLPSAAPSRTPLPRIIPEIYAPPTALPTPTLRPLPDLSPPQVPPQSLPPPDVGRRPSSGNTPDQGGGTFTPNRNVFFSRMTTHLFAANQRALAAAIRAGPRLTLDVRFWIDRDGRVLDARVARSSGIAALDRRAEQVVRDASPLPRLAPDMPHDTLELSFPVQVYR
jgi:TonB family protein